MDISQYNELKKIMQQHYSYQYKMFRLIEEAIDTKAIEYIYTIGWLISDEIRVIMFTSDKMYIGYFGAEISSIKSYRKNQIKLLELVEVNKYHKKLNITFENGDVLELSNENDTNEDWKETFYTYIIDVFKRLS